MLYTVEKDLELCEKFKLKANQLFFLKILVGDPSLGEEENKQRLRKQAIKFQTVFKGATISANDLADLLNRGIIIDNNLTGTFLYDDLELSGEWYEKLKLSINPFANQLFEAYPYEIVVETKKFIGRNTSPEKIALKYNKAIKEDVVKHKEVLSLIKWGIENNLLNIGLDKFVDVKYWTLLAEKRKLGSNITRSNVTIL